MKIRFPRLDPTKSLCRHICAYAVISTLVFTSLSALAVYSTVRAHEMAETLLNLRASQDATAIQLIALQRENNALQKSLANRPVRTKVIYKVLP